MLDDAIAARAVVAADGANSTCAGCSGCRRRRRQHTAIAVRGYADVPGSDDPADGRGPSSSRCRGPGWPAYAWSFPIGDGTANVGFGMLLPKLHATGPARQAGAARPARRAAAGPAGPRPARPPPAAVARPAAAGTRPGAAGRRRGQPDQPADRRGHLLRAGLRPAGRGGGGRPPRPTRWARTGAACARPSAGTCAPPTCSARAAQSPRFIDAAIATAARRADVFDLLVDVGLGAGTVPLPLAYAVVKAWVRGGSFTRGGLASPA